MLRIFGISVTAVLAAGLLSCSDHSGEADGVDDLPGKQTVAVLQQDARDAVDLAIVVYTRQSPFNPVSVSTELQDRLSQYQGNTTFRISTSNIWQSSAATGSKITIPPNGEFTCKYEGELTYTVTLTQGEVGLLKGEVYVEEGTHMELNDGSYEFREGRWVEARQQ